MRNDDSKKKRRIYIKVISIDIKEHVKCDDNKTKSIVVVRNKIQRLIFENFLFGNNIGTRIVPIVSLFSETKKNP